VSSTCEMCRASAGFVPLAVGRDYLVGKDNATFRAVRCPVCGFAFLECHPKDLSTYYSRRYFLAGQAAMPAAVHVSRFLLAREAHRVAKDVPSASRILEIGPGHGYFLNALAAAYPQARLWGFDITQEARLERTLSPRISVRYARDLREAEFDEKQFDLIVMRHALEHVPHLRAFLEEVGRVGAECSTLYVKVPNRASWAARVFGPYWNGMDFPRHLYYFTPKELGRLLSDVDFRRLRVGHEGDAIDWVGSTRFWLTAHGITCTGRWKRLSEMLFLGIRVGLLPLGLAARARRASSRIWILAQRTER